MSQLDLMSVPLILSVPHLGFWDTTYLFGAELCSAAGGVSCLDPAHNRRAVTTRRCFDSEWLLRSSPPSPIAYDLPTTEWLWSILNDEIVDLLRDSKLIWGPVSRKVMERERLKKKAAANRTQSRQPNTDGSSLNRGNYGQEYTAIPRERVETHASADMTTKRS
ncbi:hypothetical protein K438DRAFT_1749840 [Mycena galopus ATCC 62051]|nr:hypothetical protein K438DRAFT_1749840 [Mycena galopus ATCC 62051]